MASESKETSKDSFKVYATPASSKKKLGSATNPSGVGVASPKKGHTESK